jgi:predicted acetyltransferase
MLDIRPPGETDKEAIASVSGLAFNSPARPDRVSLAGRLCMYDGARIIATARAIDFDQWFGGSRVRCAGIAGVAVRPEDRGRGVAGSLVGELLRRARQEGRLLSALYPSTAQLYRKLGYEFAGLRPYFRVALPDLPALGLPALGLPTPGGPNRDVPARELEPGQIGQVMRCFSRFASAHNGPVESADPAYWERRVLAYEGEGSYQRTVVVASDGGPADENGVDGYASYFLEERDKGSYALACKHLVATSATALSTLIRYFRRFENAASELAWTAPPGAGPLGLALEANGFSLSLRMSRWMARVLDVPRALEARGYPSVDGEAVIRLEDPLFPDNAGPWDVRATSGKVTVRAAQPGARETSKALPIGLFSALYTGFATPSDLVLMGALGEDDPALGFLSALFAGPIPWMPDAF